MSTPPEILVLLSGGVDSTACLHFIREIDRPVCAMFVDYGQPACGQERFAARSVANSYGTTLIERSLTNAHPKKEGLISGRNAFLLSLALMESPSTVTAIAIGVHSGTDYEDCSAGFVSEMNSLFRLSTEGRVGVMAPFVEWTKADVWCYCQTSRVRIELTYSCETGGKVPCGKCLSCLDREAMHAHA